MLFQSSLHGGKQSVHVIDRSKQQQLLQSHFSLYCTYVRMYVLVSTTWVKSYSMHAYDHMLCMHAKSIHLLISSKAHYTEAIRVCMWSIEQNCNSSCSFQVRKYGIICPSMTMHMWNRHRCGNTLVSKATSLVEACTVVIRKCRCGRTVITSTVMKAPKQKRPSNAAFSSIMGLQNNNYCAAEDLQYKIDINKQELYSVVQRLSGLGRQH